MGTQSQTARLLALFKKHGRLTNRFMADHVCLRYSARIAELRSEGHIIVANRIKEGLFEYTYKGQTEEAELEHNLERIKKQPRHFSEKVAGIIRQWL